ncbi:MAG: 3-hydroxyacyl-CoA dehydrogenase NAD-binding domain-containing protein [Gemmatimonadaceae bacterium]
MTTVAIIGAGTMGHGIAYVALIAGYDVVLNDVDTGTLERAHAHIGLAHRPRTSASHSIPGSCMAR